MKIIQHVHSEDFKTYGTDKIRDRFLLDGLKEENKANFVKLIKCESLTPGVEIISTAIFDSQIDIKIKSKNFLKYYALLVSLERPNGKIVVFKIESFKNYSPKLIKQ